jgi:hypothetical protein
MNPIPPQAYTKDTLVQAYAWLQNQNDSIKEIATSPDILVSLFLKAKLQGSDFLERPSLKNFKSELKNLAGMMGELDSSSLPPAAARSASLSPPGSIPHAPSSSSSGSPSFGATSSGSASAGSAGFGAIGLGPSAAQAAVASQAAATAPTPTSAISTGPSAFAPSFNPQAVPTQQAKEALDSVSQNLIREVKEMMNLSSDTEAQRLLISVGHKQLKNLMKDK